MEKIAIRTIAALGCLTLTGSFYRAFSKTTLEILQESVPNGTAASQPQRPDGAPIIGKDEKAREIIFSESEDAASDKTSNRSYFGDTFKFRRDPELVQSLQKEKSFWIRHSDEAIAESYRAQANPADLDQKVWDGLFKRAKEEGRLIIKELSSDGQTILAVHTLQFSSSENEVYLTVVQKRLASKNELQTFCNTDPGGKELRWFEQSIIAVDARGAKEKTIVNSSEDLHLGSRKCHSDNLLDETDPEMSRFLQSEKQFWIRNAENVTVEYPHRTKLLIF